MGILNKIKTFIKSKMHVTIPAPDKIKYDPWFHDNPLDRMPIATDDNTYSSRHQSTPDYEKTAEDIVTMHEKMYRIATARNNPFHVGGSENAQAEVDYIKKHSPWPGGSENFQEK
tara:strand:- start:412 stop:756 length:345 start_codon:yes stop_codon:yes gene_type:complete